MLEGARHAFLDKFPSDAVGGSQRSPRARTHLTVRWRGPEWHETDLNGQKLFLRSRTLVQKFFEDTRQKLAMLPMSSALNPTTTFCNYERQDRPDRFATRETGHGCSSWDRWNAGVETDVLEISSRADGDGSSQDDEATSSALDHFDPASVQRQPYRKKALYCRRGGAAFLPRLSGLRL